MTRRGPPQFPPAAPPLPPMLEFASSLVRDAAKLPLAGNPDRHSHPIQGQFEQIASRPVAPTAGRDSATLS